MEKSTKLHKELLESPYDYIEVSKGTHRYCDVLPAFREAIIKYRKYNDHEARRDLNHLTAALPRKAWKDQDHPAWKETPEETLGELCRFAINTLDMMAPEGYYFGLPEGDMSCWGFWPNVIMK